MLTESQRLQLIFLPCLSLFPNKVQSHKAESTTTIRDQTPSLLRCRHRQHCQWTKQLHLSSRTCVYQKFNLQQEKITTPLRMAQRRTWNCFIRKVKQVLKWRKVQQDRGGHHLASQSPSYCLSELGPFRGHCPQPTGAAARPGQGSFQLHF